MTDTRGPDGKSFISRVAAGASDRVLDLVDPNVVLDHVDVNALLDKVDVRIFSIVSMSTGCSIEWMWTR